MNCSEQKLLVKLRKELNFAVAYGQKEKIITCVRKIKELKHEGNYYKQPQRKKR